MASMKQFTLMALFLCVQSASILAGSLQCYSCNPWTLECKTDVTCNALETCFKALINANGRPQALHGCIPENLCTNASLAQQYLGPITSMSCCNTSHCNVPEQGLQCLACTNFQCSSQSSVLCSTPTCFADATSKTFYQYLNITYERTWLRKGCDSTGLCTSTDSYFVSYQTDIESHLSHITCCNTDNCNTANASLSPSAGSLQCYGCNHLTLECTENITCNALEICFKAFTETVQGLQAIHGCVSENMCRNASLAQQYLGPITSMSCCNTSHCNAPEQQLQCLACADSTCSSQRSVLCSTPMCYVFAYSTFDSSPWIAKGCASPSFFCKTTGNHLFSYQGRYSDFLLNLTCCNENNCNTMDPIIAPPAGSLQCVSCDQSLDNCTTKNCNGLEVCLNTTYEGIRIDGCVSENLCNNINSSIFFFGPTFELSCCNTTNCNAPPNATILPPSSSAGRVLPLGLSLLGLSTLLGWAFKIEIQII